MLQAIRERLIGWILWVVIGFVVVPFAFWGIESFRGGGGDPMVAKVGGRLGGLIGGERITESQLRSAYERRYRQMQQLMGENFRPDQIQPKQFRELVLKDMIQETTLRLHGEQAGYATPDSVLVDAIRTMPAFQDDKGQFSTDVYHERLAREGYSSDRFVAEMRDSLAIDQMRRGVQQSAFVTDADLAADYRLTGQRRWLGYVQFDASRYLPVVKVDDAQVQARYDQRKSQFMSPERIKLAYVELSLERMPKAASPGTDALKLIYETEKATRFSTPEERRARHILIGFGADKAAAKKKIDDIAAKLKGGADFAQLARAESTDTGSRNDGGSLGWVKRGQMVPKFEEVLFGLKKGEVSSPVETEFGWHIIRLDDLHPPAVRPFEDKSVQDEVLALYQKKEAEKHFQEEQDKLEQLAFENPTSLDAVAKALGLEIRTTDWFGRTGATGIAANAAVGQAAFSDDVFKSGENSKPLSIGTGDVVVVRKAEYEAARQKPLEEVAGQIRDELKGEAARAKAKEEAQQLLGAVRAGQKPQDAAKKAGMEWHAAGLVGRDESKVDRQIVTHLFRLPRPQGDAPSFEQVVLANGDVAAIFLDAVKDGELASATPDDARRAREALRDADAGLEFNALRSQITSGIPVKLSRAAAEAPDEAAP